MQQAQPERELSQRPSQNLDRCSDEQFRQRFRITNSTFVALYNEIHHELCFESLRNNPISPELQLLIILRFFATVSFQLTDGDLFGVHQTSVGRIVHRVSTIIANMSET